MISSIAPAKINLSLDILSRRPDGYHELRMVMQSISLCDTISLEETETGVIEVTAENLGVTCGNDNTVFRAVEAFFLRTGFRPKNGLRFRIKKNIPLQAGLGGGSADAACTLKLLNCYAGYGLSAGELRKLGLSVGADVPFCIEGGTALAEGIGETLKEAVSLPPCHIVVCRPEIGCSTKEAYDRFDRSGSSCTDYTSGLLWAIKHKKLPEIGKALGNAFEKNCGLPSVKAIKAQMLACGAAGAVMTGSGSAVFGLFSDLPSAKTCRDELSKKYPFAFLCRPLKKEEIP